MPRLSFSERWAAAKYGLRSRLRDPRELRVTPLRFMISETSVEDVPEWMEFTKDPEIPGKQVGLVEVDKKHLVSTWSEHPFARLGLVRPLGRAVMFGAWPRHVLEDLEEPTDEPNFKFAALLGREAVVRVMPAIQLPNKSIRVPESGVEPLGVMSLAAIPLHSRMRVF